MRADLAHLRGALDDALVGQGEAKTALLLGWLAGVHVLLEGPPGCGKSALAVALAGALGESGAFVHDAACLGPGSVLQRSRAGSAERIRIARAPLRSASVRILEGLERAADDRVPELLAELARADAPFLVATRASGGAREPLPALQALLERFVLRVRMRGMLAARREAEMRALVARTPSGDARPTLTPGAGRALRAHVSRVELPSAVLHAASRWLASDRGRLPAPVLPRLLRAHAVLRGVERVEHEDLRALLELLVPGESSGASLPSGPAELAAAAVPGASQASPSHGDAGGAPSGARAPSPSTRERELAANALSSPVLEASAVDTLVAALAGCWGRGRSQRDPDASGAPRRRRPLRDLSESADADPAELLAYLDAERPDRPGVLQRERRGTTPALLILRDVSASMQGPGARWSLRLVRALVDAARSERMRVGYLEFNHVAERFTLRGRLVHRAYAALAARAAEAACTGRTSYQAALGAALEARLPRGACDVVMISDGVPVVGDPTVRGERRLARSRGWRLHTVFVGLPPVPPVLVELARETRGLAFCVAPAPRRDATTGPHWSLQPLGGHGR